MVIQIQAIVKVEIKEVNMYLSKEELLNTKGGFINSLLNVCKGIFNWGVALGSSIRRLIFNSICPM